MKQYYIGLGALVLGLLAGAVLGIALGACAAPAPQPQLPHRPLYESWDQANLKAHDDGCPSAVYVAPHGEIIQCPPY